MKLLIALSLFFSFTANASSSQWKSALALAQKNKNREAYAAFEKILKANDDDVLRDEILMNMARIKYQDGKLEDSIKLYSQVSKDSDFWLESIEEKAWAFLRQEKFEKALASYHTLTTPAFAAQVGPEAYLIGAYAALKVCDYKSIFDIFKEFKTKYKSFGTELEQLANTGTSPAVVRALAKIKSDSETSWADLGPDALKLPRYFNRDYKQGVKHLAKRDADALSKIVQKLHIIEVEAIQRMNLSQTKVGRIVRESKADVADAIEFPKEEEVWLDEVEHYHVSAKGCEVRKGAKL